MHTFRVHGRRGGMRVPFVCIFAKFCYSVITTPEIAAVYTISSLGRGRCRDAYHVHRSHNNTNTNTNNAHSIYRSSGCSSCISSVEPSSISPTDSGSDSSASSDTVKNDGSVLTSNVKSSTSIDSPALLQSLVNPRPRNRARIITPPCLKVCIT